MTDVERESGCVGGRVIKRNPDGGGDGAVVAIVPPAWRPAVKRGEIRV